MNHCFVKGLISKNMEKGIEQNAVPEEVDQWLSLLFRKKGSVTRRPDVHQRQDRKGGEVLVRKNHSAVACTGGRFACLPDLCETDWPRCLKTSSKRSQKHQLKFNLLGVCSFHREGSNQQQRYVPLLQGIITNQGIIS